MTKWREIYEDYKGAIMRGDIPRGARLPSSRDAARDRCVSRSTVLQAVDQLIAEGYAEAREGSGTFAAFARPARRSAAARAGRKAGGTDGAAPLRSRGFGPLARHAVDCRTGLPDPRLFPWDRWERAAREARRHWGDELLGYGDPRGFGPLREEVARYMARARGFAADPERVRIVSGTTQALSLLGRVFRARGASSAWLEDPVTRDVPRILAGRGVEPRFAPVDRDGMDPAFLPRRIEGAVVYVTPSHQFPTGAVLKADRRAAIAAALGEGSYVVEDDYDSEFRYEGPPLETFAAAAGDRTVYVGTFSKTLAPGLRIAFAHLPEELADDFDDVRWEADLHGPTWTQAALAVFLAEGWYEAHLRSARKAYRAKRDRLAAWSAGAAARGFSAEGLSAGIHALVRLPCPADEGFLARAEAAGARFYPVSVHAHRTDAFRDAVLLGYGRLGAEELETAIGALEAAARP